MWSAEMSHAPTVERKQRIKPSGSDRGRRREHAVYLAHFLSNVTVATHALWS